MPKIVCFSLAARARLNLIEGILVPFIVQKIFGKLDKVFCN